MKGNIIEVIHLDKTYSIIPFYLVKDLILLLNIYFYKHQTTLYLLHLIQKGSSHNHIIINKDV